MGHRPQRRDAATNVAGRPAPRRPGQPRTAHGPRRTPRRAPGARSHRLHRRDPGCGTRPRRAPSRGEHALPGREGFDHSRRGQPDCVRPHRRHVSRCRDPAHRRGHHARQRPARGRRQHRARHRRQADRTATWNHINHDECRLVARAAQVVRNPRDHLRHRSRRDAGIVRQHHRPLGLWQIDPAAGDRRTRAGDRRRSSGVRRAGDDGAPSQAGGDRAATPGAVAVEDRPGQCPPAARRQSQGQRRDDE